MFIPLGIISEYTLLKSLIKIDDLILTLKNNNLLGAALVDENLYGAMEFYQKLNENGLKAIIGLKIKIDDFYLYLYAKNYNGYKNLLKIHTLKEFNNLNINNLQEYLNDIKIILPFNSFSLLNVLPSSYLGYSNDTEKIAALFKTEKVVYFKDIRVINTQDTIYLKYLEAIDKGLILTEINTSYDNYAFSTYLEAEDKKSTLDFTSDINLVMKKNENYIPVFNEYANSEEFLVNIANKGLNKRLNGNVSKEYQNRLDYELAVIKKMGFVDYFLIVYDYVLFARKNNILVGPGRGSAAGSLVSFSLGITAIDPLKYDLLFERFLNPERITMPDIDIDFEYTKRYLVIDYVRNKYGKENVAPIMTFGTLGAKQVIRDVARVLDIDISLIDKFTSLIDVKSSLKENKLKKPVNDYLESHLELKNMYTICEKLEGLKRHISTHAAGVVISSIPLDNVIPIINNNATIMTGFSMEYLEELGLLKMDFLALKNLTIVANVLELIKENTNKQIDLSKINLQDKEIFKLFSNADTEGVFQYESSGMKNLMQKLKPTSFSDLIAAVALFRPGPMGNIDTFIARKNGLEKITYFHPDLEPILKETYGIIVYQEQVMQILSKIGGYSFAEADNIRRAMSKKKESIMLKDREHFISSAINRGYTEEVATNIYDLILKFANYGFNKAHSVAYALLGYQMAYLKVKAPKYFIVNLLNMSIGSEIKTKEYIEEARRKDIAILKPDINKSINNYLIFDNSLMLPLSSIKNLGENATKAILEEREKGLFIDYLDFLARIYGKSINKKTLISLIDAGALDSFSLTKKTMLENLDMALNYAELISNLDASFVMKPTLEDYSEYEEDILREKELNSYGFYITNHPVSKYQDKNIIKIINMPNYFNKYLRCVVLIEKIKTIKTKKGENMAFLSCSDETGMLDFTIFPRIYPSLINIKKGDIVTISGMVTKRYDTYQITVQTLNKI